MSFLKNILDNLFGGIASTDEPYRGFDNHRQHGEQFRNPIWQNDQEDDDEYGDDYRNSKHFKHSGPGFHFEVFTDPVEITRFFESEMENMMKNIFSFDMKIPSTFENSPSLPAPSIQQKSLRDKVLKPEFSQSIPDYNSSGPKTDEDLDGKISAEDFSRVWKDPVSQEPQQLIPNNNFNFTFSSVYRTTRHPDGVVEEKKVVTDGEGNTETTIKKQIGDKSYTVITKKDKNGVEIKTENFQNIDESEIENFGNKWKPVDEPKPEIGTLSKFPWHKFFGPNPKL